MSSYYVGTRAQVRAALRGLELALRVPRQAAPGSLSARYSIPRPLGGGQWAFAIKSTAVPLLSPADQARVVPSLPSVRRLTPGSLSLPPGVGVSDPLCDEYEYLPEERWQPVVVRARFQHSALPITAGATTLYDGAGGVHDLGTQYARADGTREFVVQPVATLGPQFVAILWSAGRDSDPGEALYIEQMLVAAVAGGLIEAHWSCSRVDGLWMPDSLRADVLAAWPAEWRSGGSPCVGPAQ